MTSGALSLTRSVRMIVSASATWFWTTLMSGFSASKSAMIWLKSSSASPLNWKKFKVVTPDSAFDAQPADATIRDAAATAAIPRVRDLVRDDIGASLRYCGVFRALRRALRRWTAAGAERVVGCRWT